MKNKTKKAEQERVNHVIQRIDSRLDDIVTQIESAHQETSRIEQDYGDNTKVNVFEVDDRMETNAAVQQQKQMVARAVENETILRNEQQQLTRLQTSPYFGRIDVAEDGDTDTLYIGTATFMDQNDFLVYDWRAPVASIYYNGTLGPVNYDTPTGQISAELLNKRQFTIQDGKITAMFDTNETVGDEMLQAVLGEQSDTAMQNIVATIQKEQNDIIRDTTSDLLVVQGVAGSGKTSAVLQRVAYLLYHSRSQLDADQMVLFSPNQLFANYISAVLPSLGEKNMRQATLAEFFAKRFSGLHVQTMFERFERDQISLPETTKTIRRFKESHEFLTAIDDYLKANRDTPFFVDIELNGEVFFSANTITRIYQQQPKNALAADKFLATKNALIKRLNQRIGIEIHQDWVQDAVTLLSDSELRDLLNGHHFESGDDEARFISRQVVADAFAPVYDAIYNDYFFDSYQEYGRFLTTIETPVDASIWQTMVESVMAGLEQHQLNLDDAAPILYLRDQLTGSGINRGIQYVFVDEMQDYSMAQLFYLHHAFPRAKLTFLGDAKQDVFTSHYQPSDFIHEIGDVFKGMHVRLIELNRSYRSTAPITNFGKALLDKSDHIQAFNRDGDKPQVILTNRDQAISALSHLVDEQLTTQATVAILTKDQAAANQLYATLHLDQPVTLLNLNNHQLKTGCLILPVYLAKGLEFDAVIGYDISADTYQSDADRDILYTLSSRALHSLSLVCINQPSPLLVDLPSDLYTETKDVTSPVQ
ncbi:RNA polymerase recycling motor HelD [Lacticaseibacillus saniviri]